MSNNCILVVDTETTGLPIYPRGDVHSYDHLQIVELAYIVFDASGNRLKEYSTLIQPHNWKIPVEATTIHGITTELAVTHGIPIEIAIKEFESDLNRSTKLVAHNLEYDQLMLQSTLLRLGCPTDYLLMIPRHCTMKHEGRFIRLDAVHQKYFPAGHSHSAHRALGDANVCADIYWAQIK